MSEVENSKGKALALCLIPALMLVYFVIGALSSGISVPGRDGALTLSGQAAWIACLFPLLWLVGDVFRHYPAITLFGAKRKIIATLLTVTGAGLFFYAIIL